MSVLYKKETYQIISCSQVLTQEKSLEMTAFSEWKLKSSPTDELRVTTIRHHHTDRVSGDTYHTVFHSHQQKRGRWERWSTLQVQMALETNRTFSHSWQAKHVAPTKPYMKPHRETAGKHWLESNFAEITFSQIKEQMLQGRSSKRDSDPN